MFVDDENHHRSANALRNATDSMSVPSVVIAEVAHFLGRARKTSEEARFLLSIAEGRMPVADPVSADYRRAAELVRQYADFPLGAVDALIVAMAERLRVTTIFTLDVRHFSAIRPAHCESFTLVP